jgi:hypothetical protein
LSREKCKNQKKFLGGLARYPVREWCAECIPFAAYYRLFWDILGLAFQAGCG